MAILSNAKERDICGAKRDDCWGAELLGESAGEERYERLPHNPGIVGMGN